MIENYVERFENLTLNDFSLENNYVVHSDTIHLKPWKILFGCNLAYFPMFVVSIPQNDSKKPLFWVVGLRIVFLKPTFGADLEVKIVPG